MEGNEVVGYALFGLPKRSTHVRLAHLCVPEEHRSKGIARSLIQTLCERHPERLGIRARCRRDYELSGMWTSLGFVPLGEGWGAAETRRPWTLGGLTWGTRTCSRTSRATPWRW
ncbi:GNAT family N-acetyltransferase [Streptomyces sp. M10(2022)]